MDAQLNTHELRFVKQFLKSTLSKPERHTALPLASLVLGLCGLILGSYAVVLFVQNPTDYVARFVLLPGFGGGFFLLLVGVWVFEFSNRSAEKKKMALVLSKLLPNFVERKT